MQVSRSIYSVLVLLLAGILSIPAVGQSLVSGDIAGTITDPSGAVVPNATVSLKNNGTGQTQTTTANNTGAYRFSLLPPGQYTVSATASGFQNVEKAVTVVVGQATALNLQLAVGGSTQTVEVTAEGGVIQTQNGNISTTFTPEQVQLVPNPGNDLSFIVQTAPGAVMNTQAGFGNSSTYGLPATSNLFTVNGMNENDPFLNLNNSGATNLLLGQNDVQEATIVNNGYSTQYGGLAGANVNYVTKSGTNNWHGNVNYFWNGRALNANSWFAKQGELMAGKPNKAPFDNANQWSASLGGPVIHNKTFFFVDYEGLRVVLPTTTLVHIPTASFETATLANLGSTGNAAEIPFYQQMFSLWNSAPGASNATPTPGGGCGDLTTMSNCAQQFRSVRNNFTHEWLLTGRLDQQIGSSDRAYLHFRSDHGLQATYTDPISKVFNAQSVQPQYEGQINETHTFSNNAVNQFILSGSWYSAIFQPASMSAATALMPYRLRFTGSTFSDLGHDLNIWPQGRNVSQYQIVDDFSKVYGSHNLKFGVNYRRNDVSDHDVGVFTTGELFGESLSDFFNGGNTATQGTFIQAFTNRQSQPVALYSLGVYGQDEWAVRPTFKLTFGLRAEHDSNPVCITNCFARLTSNFSNVSHDVNQPYNQAIRTGLHQALPAYTRIAWEPRLGFAWTPRGSAKNTVLRGGIGIFNDFFPAFVADNFMENPPLYNQFFVAGTLAPGTPGNMLTAASSSNAAFTSGFNSGQTFATLSAIPGFFPPSFFNSARSIHSPQYQEWNLELQQGIGQKMSFSINYVGNHQIFGPVQNGGVNAFCDPTVCGGSFAATGTAISNFADLPTAAPDMRFGTVTEISSANVGNYNGVTVSLQRRFSALQFQANYTYSHALDEISNAGLLPFNATTNTSILNPEDPYHLRRYNYGNADYDVRHYASLNYVWTTPKLKGWVGAIASWTVSGTVFARSGLPFSVTDGNATGILSGFNYGVNGGNEVLANFSGRGPIVCTRNALTTPCMTLNQFSLTTNNWGMQRRNQLWGPHYFDTDLTVMKNFHLPISEASNLGIGLQFFNILNHPNFDQPDGEITDAAALGGGGTFGNIINTVSVPTSILGSFLGGDASPRLIQVKATLSF